MTNMRVSHAMRISGVIAAIPALAGLLCSGCTVEETITVTNTDVSGMQSFPPVHVTNDSTKAARCMIHISRPGGSAFTGGFTNEPVSSSQGPARPSQQGSIHWTTPPAEAGADLDLPLSKSLSLALGANTSGNLWGYNIGLGLHGDSHGVAERLDLGFQWQNLSYGLDYIKTTTVSSIFGESSTTELRHTDESSSHGDFYGSLTINSTGPPGALRIFAQLGYCHQTIYDVENRTIVFPFAWSDQTSLSCSYMTLTPGVYFDISRSFRLLAGVRCSWILGLDSIDPSFCATPMVCVDFGF